jgi:hypothetical protein
MHNVHSKFSSVGGGNFKEYAKYVQPCWRVNEPITKTSKFTVVTNNLHKILLHYQLHHCCSKLMQPVAHKDFCHFYSLWKLQVLTSVISHKLQIKMWSCYTIQLMHYSHFKTHSLRHLKPLKSPDHQQKRTPNTHRWHTHAATYCLITQTQRTQINGRNSNSTKHSEGPPKDGREKRPKHVGFYTTNTFLTFYWF